MMILLLCTYMFFMRYANKYMNIQRQDNHLIIIVLSMVAITYKLAKYLAYLLEP